MNGRKGRFWLVSLATLVTMSVTASLGLWQLDRAAQKTALQAQIEARSALPPLSSVDLLAPAPNEDGLHRPVRLTGEWVADATLFLDNRQMQGRNGFIVLTPLKLAGSERALLVQRGWVPRNFQDRTLVPVVPTPSGAVEIEGRLAPPPGKLYELGAASGGAIRQNIEVVALADELRLSLLPLSVMQTDTPPDGLQRQWPVVNAGVHKHHGYAFQWFGLCALAGFLYIWFQFISPRRRRPPYVSDT